MDEFDVPVDILDFHFDGSKQVAFHLNIARHMEVTKVKENGQAEKLGVMQGDILLKINDEDVSKNWEKATGCLRSYVQNKQQFTITFVRRKVESLVITVKRGGNSEFNGKYIFHKRDKSDDECPIYIKNEEEFDFDDEKKETKYDPLISNSKNMHIIQRVYCNPETSEALWVIRNGRDEHFYMCVTNEYLPPQHGWEIVPESGATYPAPGLAFHAVDTKFVTKMLPDDDDAKSNVHDALNIGNRNRKNKERHQKTLTRMRATLGSTKEMNESLKSGNKRSNTGGVSGIVMGVGGAATYKMGGKKKGFNLFGNKKNKKKLAKIEQKPKILSSSSKMNNNLGGNASASDTEEDTAKLEAIWKDKLETTTKNAINQLTHQHQEEILKKDDQVTLLTESGLKLKNNLNESSEYYYQLYVEKCELSLVLQEKQCDLNKSKLRIKEMGKRFFQQQQRTEELESKMTELTESFSSRISSITNKPQHRPTQSTVNDLANIEQQFRNLLKKEDSKEVSVNVNSSYLEEEIISLKSKLSNKNIKIESLNFENNKLKEKSVKYENDMNMKDMKLANLGGSDQFYADRLNKSAKKISDFQQIIYNLMSLLQNVEQEYMKKVGKLPKVTKAIDWRTEYDPKKYKSLNNKGHHPEHQTFVINDETTTTTKKKKKHKKHKKHKNKGKDLSATESQTLPDNERWSGWNLDNNDDNASGDDSNAKHRTGQSIRMNL